MSGPRNLTADVDLDLKGLMGSIWRKKWLILLLTLLAAVLIFVSTSMIAERYKADAQILIKKRESIFTRIQNNEFQPNGGEFDEQAVGSQVLVLSSDDLAIRVIKRLNLESHPEFAKKAVEPGILDLARNLVAPSADGNVIDDEAGSEPVVVDPGVLKQFKEQLTVYAAEQSRVAVVEFWSTDRSLAKLVPNAVAEEYIEFTRSERLESDRSATGFLEPEIQELRKKVIEAEEKVAEFRSQSDILLGNNNALLATQQLSEVSSELSRVKAERLSAEAKIESIRAALENGSSLDVIPEVISSPLIQRLREREVNTKAQISELSSTLLPNHPRIKALRSQLPEISNQIRQAANNILRSLENNVGLARKQEAALLQDVNRLKAEASRVNEAEVELRALEREAAAQRERLESYLGRFNEAQSRQASGYVPSEARIIERAVLPAESYFPQVIPFTVAGSLGMMILSIVGVLSVELLSGRAFKPMNAIDPRDIPETVPAGTGADENMSPAAATTSVARGANSPVHSAPPVSPTMDDMLRDPQPTLQPPATAANDRDVFGMPFALQAIEGIGATRVAVVSPDEVAESAVAVEISRYLADRGKRVAVVDFTGDGRTSARMLGKTGMPGLFDVLSGARSLRDALYQDSASSAHVLATGTPQPGTDLSNLGQLVTSLEKSYDYPVFSCGNSGLAGLAKVANATTVVIIPTTRATFNECKALERQLMAAGYADTIMVRSELAGQGAHQAA